MSNLRVQDRNQFERSQYTSPARLSAGGRRAMQIYSVVGLAVLAVLTFAAVQVFDGWHHLIVLGDIVLVFLAIAAWIYSLRINP
jgi:hypothetical protein